MFPSREWAVRIPAFTLVTGISAVAIFIGLAIVSEQEPRRGQWPIHTPTIFIGFSAYFWWTWSLDPNTAIEVVRNPIPWAHSRRDETVRSIGVCVALDVIYGLRCATCAFWLTCFAAVRGSQNHCGHTSCVAKSKRSPMRELVLSYGI